MPLLLAALTFLLHWQTLDQNLAPFTERFNAYSDRYRLVMLVSPT
jgi:hypothetical protein